eukprot:13306510-Heterocapsa_arctica.AAC.1
MLTALSATAAEAAAAAAAAAAASEAYEAAALYFVTNCLMPNNRYNYDGLHSALAGAIAFRKGAEMALASANNMALE